MTERQAVEIDYCPACRGVWLDRAELDKIVDRSVGTAPTEQPTQPAVEGFREQRRDEPRYREDDDDGRDRKRKKRGGWLEDFFDFD
jgi:Zn-finger nucleic acid-binding protein